MAFTFEDDVEFLSGSGHSELELVLSSVEFTMATRATLRFTLRQ